MEEQEEHLNKLSGVKIITIPVSSIWRWIKSIGGKDEKVNERFSDPILDRLRDSIRGGNKRGPVG